MHMALEVTSWNNSGREHGGPHHSNGALILGQFWRNTWYLSRAGYPHHKDHVQFPQTLVGVMVMSTDGIFLFWLHLLGWSSWLTCHLGSGGHGLQLSFTIGCQKQSSSTSPAWVLLQLCSLWAGSAILEAVILTQLEGRDIFQYLHISKCGQGLRSTL